MLPSRMHSPTSVLQGPLPCSVDSCNEPFRPPQVGVHHLKAHRVTSGFLELTYVMLALQHGERRQQASIRLECWLQDVVLQQGSAIETSLSCGKKVTWRERGIPYLYVLGFPCHACHPNTITCCLTMHNGWRFEMFFKVPAKCFYKWKHKKFCNML